MKSASLEKHETAEIRQSKFGQMFSKVSWPRKRERGGEKKERKIVIREKIEKKD